MDIVTTLVNTAKSLYGKRGLTPDEEALMKAALQNEQERLNEVARIRNAYQGKFPKPLKVDYSDPATPVDHNVIVNRVKPVISHGVFYLFGTLPDWEIPDKWDVSETGESSPYETALTECLDYMNWPALALKWAQSGGMGGTAYLKICLPDPDHALPYLQVLDPGATSILFHPRDMDRRLGWIWEYNSIETRNGAAVTRVDQQIVTREDVVINGKTVAGWVIRDCHYNRAAGVASSITVDNEEVWPYEWPPIIDCQNLPLFDSVYGEPDVDDLVIDLNNATNAVLSDRKKILYYHGATILYATGVGAGSITRNAEGVFIIQGEGTLGQITPAISGVEGESLEHSIYEAISEVTHMPAEALGKPTPQGVPSGVALTIKFTPVRNKIEAKRRNYGPAFITACQRLLHIMTGIPDIRVHLTWPEVVPTDPQVAVNIAEAEDRLGVSKQTIFGKLGFRWEQEVKNKEDEAAMELKKMKAMQAEIDAFRKASDVPQSPEDQAALQEEQASQQRADMEGE
jgi:hypothetical protein